MSSDELVIYIDCLINFISCYINNLNCLAVRGDPPVEDEHDSSDSVDDDEDDFDDMQDIPLEISHAVEKPAKSKNGVRVACSILLNLFNG